MASILNLGPRMEAIVDLVEPSKYVADIGCDHGYITAELILENKAQFVIATDKSEECLNKAITFCDSVNINAFISFRQGDGFKPITKYDKINCTIIAGMGGKEIINIMLRKPKHLKNFIFQPMTDVVELREFLIANHFKILVDKLVKDGEKYYNVIKVKKGRCNLTELELYFGKNNFTDNYEVFYEYLTMQHKKLLELKDQFGELSSAKLLELKYIESALQLFDNPENQL